MTRSRCGLSLVAALVALTVHTPAVLAQAEEALRLQGVVPAGIRTQATESWGTFHFTLTNNGPEPRNARVVVVFPGRPDVQYGRDVWVPGQAAVTGWVPVGPAPDQKNLAGGRDIKVMLFDRTGGKDRLILPPTEERVRSRPTRYTPREPTTVILLEPGEDTQLLKPESSASRVRQLVRAYRKARGLSDSASVVADGLLPTMPEAFDGIDHFVLASNKLADDPPARAAVRRWVQQGGKLWVMLDRVRPDTVAAILGDDANVSPVDRTGLTSVRIYRGSDEVVAAPLRQFEEPVPFVRVVPAEGDRVLHSVDRWPASFVRTVGRGKVLFTTVGPTAWYRGHAIGEQRGDAEGPVIPAHLGPLEDIGAELQPLNPPVPWDAQVLSPLLTEEIGYSVVPLRTAASILGVFLVMILAIGLFVRRARRPEMVGWMAPAAALTVAVFFVAIAASSRGALPPTVAVAGIIDVVPGSNEGAMRGVVAVYRPEAGDVALGSNQSGMLELDADGLEGQTRTRVQTDAGRWVWDRLALPTGVRTGPFEANVPTADVSAVVQFGPNGLEGTFAPGDFKNPADLLIATSTREPLAPRLQADGRFAAGPKDILAPGQYLAADVLDDAKQRRQAVYRHLFAGKAPEHWEGRDMLLAWVEPASVPFTTGDDGRSMATALAAVPLEYRRTPPGTSVTIPRPFVGVRRVLDGRLVQPTLESTQAVDMRLRFQLPASVVPLDVERAKLSIRIRAIGRTVTVALPGPDGKSTTLTRVENPEAIDVDLSGAQVKADARGGIAVQLTIGSRTGEAGDGRWTIEAIGLEVAGKTQAEGK